MMVVGWIMGLFLVVMVEYGYYFGFGGDFVVDYGVVFEFLYFVVVV